ncbi:MAG: ribosome small subunit-dependent GTPase A [Imperialibacter sp.]
MEYNHLSPLGWNTFFEDQIAEDERDFIVGRVSVENKTNYQVLTVWETYIAEATGRLFYMAETDAELPKVGDWVLMMEIDKGKSIIQKVLERQSLISRKVPGKKLEEQIIATNIDKLFIVQGLDGNFNLARLERYLTLAQNVEPVIVLNKADLCPNPEDFVRQVKERVKNVEVVVATALQNQVDALRPFIQAGSTIAIVGSSGVGKSTIINSLIGEPFMETGKVRQLDSKGRHTTTSRHLMLLKSGGVLIDTPGMRELQLWGDQSRLSTSFEDIEALSQRCKFKNCTHTDEKGCAITQALEEGSLDEAHWINYAKMKKELAYLETRQDVNAMLEKKKKWKKIHKDYKAIQKNRNL